MANHVCFYANLRKNEQDKDSDIYGDMIRARSLTRCHSSKLKQKLIKSYYILKGSTISWYPSNHEPYFLIGQIYLQFCTGTKSLSFTSLKRSTQFRIFISTKIYTFIAKNQQARANWVKALKQVVFACQHNEENMRILIPLSGFKTV
ncbi:hypothetical protein PPACK8108_LOCUS25625 [Phakopsora pachyrhizi]|uniref:PH domain-containing protein n=1 Tax=Phakopsora pachyrhizi TaxID=170000 RepID=A0AAV0BSC5_PHAPC|nr:hypothetical protein PPACK8108_LOCUS25625 [Phakopsora pachyrhizi]